MKTISEETKQAISDFLRLSEKYAKCYFWSARGTNANTRRTQEQRDSMKYEGDGISLDFSLSISCNHYYVTKSIMIDGKTTNANALKKFIK